MHKTLHASDVLVLTRLFAGEHHQIVVYDPHRTLRQDAPLFYPIFSDLHSLRQWLDLNTTPPTVFLLNAAATSLASLFDHPKINTLLQSQPFSTAPYCHQLASINNPDTTLRWIFPRTNSHPVHLDLYNASGWKAKGYRSLSRLAFRLGRAAYLYTGRLSLHSKTESVFFQNLATLDYEELAIFTGTVSTTRKAIVALSRGGRTRYFVKLPIFQGADALLRNEREQLQQLDGMDWPTLQLPRVHPLARGIALENNTPSGARNSTRWQWQHAQALDEMYTQTQRQMPLGDLQALTKIEASLSQLVTDLAPTPDSTLSQQANRLLVLQLYHWRTLPLEKTWTVARAHGDFTPWNMYLGRSGLYLYDWELAQCELPLLVDAFHFIFQTGILIHRHSWSQLKTQLAVLRSSDWVQRWQRRGPLDFDWHLKFYLLFISTHYLPQYLHQQPLHPQAFWLMQCWERALSEWKEIPVALAPEADAATVSAP